MPSVVHAVRTAAAGASIVVLTNACGAVNAAFTPGQIVLVSDHINLTAVSVTNMAAGMAGPLSHGEVLEAGRAGEERAAALLSAALARLASP